MTLLPHQQRVVEESDQLLARLQKLTAFLSTPTFDALPKAERHLLVAQHTAMTQYGVILHERIAAFSPS